MTELDKLRAKISSPPSARKSDKKRKTEKGRTGRQTESIKKKIIEQFDLSKPTELHKKPAPKPKIKLPLKKIVREPVVPGFPEKEIKEELSHNITPTQYLSEFEVARQYLQPVVPGFPEKEIKEELSHNITPTQYLSEFEVARQYLQQRIIHGDKKKFFRSLYSHANRRGTLTKEQMKSVKKAMAEEPIELFKDKQHLYGLFDKIELIISNTQENAELDGDNRVVNQCTTILDMIEKYDKYGGLTNPQYKYLKSLLNKILKPGHKIDLDRPRTV